VTRMDRIRSPGLAVAARWRRRAIPRVLVSAVGLSLLPSAAPGQYLPLLPSTRPALDIGKVPLGAWAEYRHSGPAGDDTQRFALVGDVAEGRVLEVSVQSAAFRQPLLFRFVVPRGDGATASSRSLELQVGDGQPIRALLQEGPPFGDFLSEKAAIGTKRVQVAGRTLTAKGYRHHAEGDSWEYWISADAPPLGFVSSIKRLSTTTSRLELVHLGRGASSRMKPGARIVEGAAITRALLDNMSRPASQ
jgi:hypothetical protein